MDRQRLLKEISELNERGVSYQEQGNYQFSKKCYLKITILMKQLLKQSENLELIEVYKEKIIKYIQAAKRVEKLEHQKGNKLKDRSKVSVLNKNSQQKLHQSIEQVKEQVFPIKNFPLPIEKLPKKPVIPSKDIGKHINKPNLSKNKQIQIDDDIKEMIVRNINLSFKDIVGMEKVKQIIEEAVIKPRKRPDLFQGIRAPPRGVLFYGPPGNGKTYIAKALAFQSKCTFFAVSASSIMNKFVGEAEKNLRKLFKAAEAMSPSIIFIDQIDSLLTARSDKQNQVSRRVKTQFLVLMDGVMSAKDGDILLIGATNLPKQLDIAALRRFNKLIYIGLPDPAAREGMIFQNLKDVKYNLSSKDISILIKALQGYSASQIKDIAKQAAMLPLKEITKSQFDSFNEQNMRDININDFLKVIQRKKPLLTNEDLKQYEEQFK